MGFLCFAILRNCKFKRIRITNTTKRLSTDVSQVEVTFDKRLEGDPSLIEVLPSWKQDEEVELRTQVLQHMQVIPNFITEAEEASLLAEVEPTLKRMRYEFDHWDNAIEGYRETERSSWSPGCGAVLARVRAAFAPAARLLPHAHVLDLAAAGHIRAHVDAVRFCGDTIAGLCLVSAAVMRLAHARRPRLALDALLQRRSLYVMSGVARYEFTHAVLGGAASVWRGESLPRRRRVAVIFRERPKSGDTS